MTLPWLGLTAEVDAFLAKKTQANIDSTTTATVGGVPWYKLLYAYRIKRGDIRGAASVLMAQLEARQRQTPSSSTTSTSMKSAILKPRQLGSAARKASEKAVLDEFLVLINALAVVGNDNGGDGDGEGKEGWVFVGGSGDGIGKGKGKDKKRKVVTLADVRSLYQEELDRQSVLESGRWGILGE